MVLPCGAAPGLRIMPYDNGGKDVACRNVDKDAVRAVLG